METKHHHRELHNLTTQLPTQLVQPVPGYAGATPRRYKLRCLTVVCTAAMSMLAGCGSAPQQPLPTVESVDIGRYMGDWYEIAKLPNRFQAMCASDTRARYRIEGENVRVDNRCRKANGEVESALGIAKVVPDSGNAKLRVSFFRPFYGDYWILAIAPDYQWVLIGEPSRQYAWILARTQKLDESTLERLLSRAAELGFARATFERTPQVKAIDN